MAPPSTVGDLAPLQPRGVGIARDEGGGPPQIRLRRTEDPGGDESRNDAAAVLAGPPAAGALAPAGTDRALRSMSQGVAGEVHPTALPGGMEQLGDGRLEPVMGIRDHQLDGPQAALPKLAREGSPKCLRFRAADIHRASGPIPRRDVSKADRRRGSRKPGKQLPFRSLGIRRSPWPRWPGA